jgi:phage N-6-adenine-methyltransferase
VKGAKQIFASARTAEGRAAGSTDDWGTPQGFFDLLDAEFGFTLDPCANEGNAKAAYFSIEEGVDGLEQDWGGKGTVAFVNFPYSQAKVWASKCLEEAKKGAKVVVLCAARTDTGWFHELAAHAKEIRFVRGRLAFVGPNGAGQSATFPSSVIVLGPGFHVNEGNIVVADEHYRLFQGTIWTVPSRVRR